MFHTIDAKIVISCQWLVRQVELYTNLTRDDVVNFNLKLLKYILIAILMWAIAAIVISGSFSFLTMVIFVLIFSSRSTYLDFKKIAKKRKQEGVLSEEILTRESGRIFLLFLLLIFLPIAFLTLIYMLSHLFYLGYISNTAVTPLEEVYSVFLVMILCMFFVIEYLLCTTSLSKGERERRKMEKELKFLVPIPIKSN